MLINPNPKTNKKLSIIRKVLMYIASKNDLSRKTIYSSFSSFSFARAVKNNPMRSRRPGISSPKLFVIKVKYLDSKKEE